MEKKSGSILIVCLWILAILTILAVELGHEASIDLKLARNQRDRIKAFYLSKAGVSKAIALLKDDIKADSQTKDYDTIYQCGINLKDRNVLELFEEVFQSGREGFRIGFMNQDQEFEGGFTDEAARANINGNEFLDYRFFLMELFELKGIDDAQSLAQTLADWIDEDSDVKTGGQEDSMFKNKPFSIPEELLLVLDYFYRNQGEEGSLAAARETFSLIKDSVTAYAQHLNINTISADMLKAVFRCAVDMMARPDITRGDADSLVLKIENFRNGEDNVFGNADDNIFKTTGDITDKLESALNEREKQVLDRIKSCFCVKSDIFRIHVAGYAGRVKREITAVYNRSADCEGIMYWHEN